jgi:hypothetical protein
MKSLKSFFNNALLAIVLAWAFANVVCAQEVISRRWIASVGLGTNLAQMYGDLRQANRQFASDQNSVFGQIATYENKWQAGMLLNCGLACWVTKPLGLELGCNVGTFGSRESLTIAYEPAYSGYLQKIETVVNKMLFATPKLGVVTKWHGVGVQAGVAANIFLRGRTKWENDLEKIDGAHEIETRLAHMDTQDQPIYIDAAVAGGFVDYTYLNPANHGANPIWLSAYAGASYTLWQDRSSPFISFDWNFALQEATRSRNPTYSLRNGLQSPFRQDIDQGTRFKSFSAVLGYRF